MESEIENWTAKAEAWRRPADLSRRRAAIVRKVAGMMRGTEPLPDGLTRAALVVCGTAWRGFEWVRRGVDVSPAVWEVERNAAADKLAFYAGEVAREAGKVSDAFHAADALAALRGESLTPPAEWTSPALERLRQIRDAVAGTLDALNEEGEAWRDFEAAYMESREAVPVEEIKAARARLEAEEAAKARLDGSGALDALEGLRAELRGVAEGVANLAADKRKTSKARRDAGRMGGEESARQRADGERKRILAAALQLMRRETAAGKSIKQAARDAMRKGKPLLKSNGEPLCEDSLVRYFKAAKSNGGA